MAGQGKSRAPSTPTVGFFDPKGIIAFPPRVEVLGSLHGNQLFGYAHAGLSARTPPGQWFSSPAAYFFGTKRTTAGVTATSHLVRGVQGFSCTLPSGAPIFVAPRKTLIQADASATLVVEDFATADELFEGARQKTAFWSTPRPVNPRNEPLADGEARCTAIVENWADRFIFAHDDPDKGKKGLRRPQIGALYAVLAHWSTTDAAATVVMPTGTGKTETMLALLICAQLRRVMVVVPNSALRDQIAEKFLTLGKLAECGCIPPDLHPPVVARLRHRPKSVEEVDEIFRRANVVVATMQVAGQCLPAVQEKMAELCSHLFIDEAHHIAAKTWADFKAKFAARTILQFTATPFRTDGKRVDGKFIYSYPLARAQKEGYFRQVSFVPIEEFDPDIADRTIARRVGQVLKRDLKAGLDHLLMARADTKERATDLARIYASEFPDLHPVTIHTGVPAQERKERLNALRDRQSRILICVDMFGEGFDLPQLKIAALHDKHKSLAITLQFVGRFTRSLNTVGDATVVANIADEAISNALRNLYAEDADWNFLLKMLSEAATGRARKRNEVLAGFTGVLPEIPLQVLTPRMSAVVYRTTCDEWSPMKVADVVSGARLHAGPVVNPEHRLAIFVTRDDEPVRWGAIKQIQDVEWNLHILHWNEEQKLLFIHSSSKDFHERIAAAVGGSDQRIAGMDVFRAMSGIKRLVLNNLGLSHAFGKNIRYTMFMGADIAEGLSESSKQNRRMSNVFGLGFEDDERTTFGCSFKGRLWSHKIAYDLSEFTEWCAHVGRKLLDTSISVDSVLGNLIKARAITERPPLAPLMVMWPESFQHEPEDRIDIELGRVSAPLFDCAIEPASRAETGPLSFAVSAADQMVIFEVVFREDSAQFRQVDGLPAFGHVRRVRRPLADLFNEDPPIIHFVNGDFLVFNELFELPKGDHRASFDSERIAAFDWKGVNLRKEAQGPEKDRTSIQHRMIRHIEAGEFGAWNVVFDGDGKGEVADIVALRRQGDEVVVGLWHCKYSGGEDAGVRISDLYEVCGQAQKSVHWREDPRRILRHLLHQEDARTKANSSSRLESGNRSDIQRMSLAARQLAFKYEVYIVQPGLSKAKAAPAFLDVLGASELFLRETYSMPLMVIASP
jgi:superfamily II DNA or RNA helicase